MSDSNLPAPSEPPADGDPPAGGDPPELGPGYGLDDFEDLVDDGGLSLEELTETYAELVTRGEEPYEPAATAETPQETPPETVAETEEDAEDDPVEITPRSIVEAMLFVGHPQNEPLTAKEVAGLMRGVRPAEIDEAVAELNAEYDRTQAPYQVASVGPGYRLELRPQYQPLRNNFYGKVKAARLTQAAVDVLAIVAYNQPISRAQVDQMRGKPSGGVLSQLVRRELLLLERVTQEAAPAEESADDAAGKRRKSRKKPRKTILAQYRTTERFLDLFGLESLSELPQSQEMDRDF